MIAIKLDVTSALDLKAALNRFMPSVKSSHRVEALARGLGFSTYASLRYALSDNRVVEVNENNFQIYLMDHGFTVAANTLWRVVGSAAVVSVMRIEPRLQAFGFGAQRPLRGKYKTAKEERQEAETEFQKDRAEMLSECFAESFLRSMAFLRLVPKTKTIRPRAGSYRIKHIAEEFPCQYPNGTKLGPAYVTNGALIAAAIYAGFDAAHGLNWDGYEHPNAEFNMPVLVLDDLDAKYRPDGAIGSTRREIEHARHRREFDRAINHRLRDEAIF